ncbi:MAG: Crp/Fnr family transcriptional regulator [Planctomycetota bacterium]
MTTTPAPQPAKRAALRVAQVGACTCLKPDDVAVFTGRSLDLANCSAVCMDALCDIYPVARDILAKVGPDDPIPSMTFPCSVRGCGARFRLTAAPTARPASKSAVSTAVFADLTKPARSGRSKTIVVPDKGPFMARLPEEEVQMIFAIAEAKTYQPGEVMINQGIVGDRLFIVSSGEAEVFLHAEGKEDTVLATIGIGECIGEISLLTGVPTTAAVRAKSVCKAMVVQKEKFEQLLDDSQVINRIFSKMLAERFKQTNKAVSDERTASYKGRLKTMMLSDLLQSLNQARRAGVLMILNPAHQMARIGFKNGNPTGMVMLDLTRVSVNDRFEQETMLKLEPFETGLEPFFDLFTWADGQFRFEEGQEELRGPIKMDIMSILMEGARRLDEAKRQRISSET